MQGAILLAKENKELRAANEKQGVGPCVGPSIARQRITSYFRSVLQEKQTPLARSFFVDPKLIRANFM